MAVVEPGAKFSASITFYTGSPAYIGPWKPTNRNRLNITRQSLLNNGAWRTNPLIRFVTYSGNTERLAISPHTGNDWSRLRNYLTQFFGYPMYLGFNVGSMVCYFDELDGGDPENEMQITCSLGGQLVDFDVVRGWARQNLTANTVYAITNPGRRDSDGVTQVQLPADIGTTRSNIAVPRGSGRNVTRNGYVTIVSREFTPRELDEVGQTLTPALETIIVEADIGTDFIPRNVNPQELVDARLTIDGRTYETRRASFLGNNTILIEAEIEVGI